MRKQAKPPTVKRVVYSPQIKYRRLGRRCEAEVSEFTQRWRVFAGQDLRCTFDGIYSVDGMYLCKRHAGDLLLSLLTEGEEVIK